MESVICIRRCGKLQALDGISNKSRLCGCNSVDRQCAGVSDNKSERLTR